jgi:ATP-dependent exoDNAse (exonuclease V) alpha subunit
LSIDEHFYDDEKTAPKYQYEEKPKPLRVESVCKFTRKNKYELDIKEWNDTPDTNDFEQLSDTIIKMGSCLINGRAGTGKTHLIKMIIKKLEAQKKNIYKLAPTNKASRLIDGMTIHKMYVSLCLSRMGKSKIIKNLKNINTIIIDEISMVHEIFYRMFNLIKKYCPHINFIIVGDFLQLKPVNDRYTGNYSNSTTLLELCNYNRLVLDKCRRSDDTLFNLTNPTNIPSINPQLFKTNQLFFNNVAYTHKTRKNVNGLCMEKYIKEHPYYITAQALDSNDKTQISYLAQGMPIISYKNIPKQKILNTDIFTITKINRKTKEFSFKSENIEEQTMKADKFSTMFYPAFCITIHASQGQTFETPYTIWDWTILDNTLKYVALTRATDIKNISIHI